MRGGSQSPGSVRAAAARPCVVPWRVVYLGAVPLAWGQAVGSPSQGETGPLAPAGVSELFSRTVSRESLDGSWDGGTSGSTERFSERTPIPGLKSP